MKPICICISIGVVLGGAILALLMIGGSDLLREWGKIDVMRNTTEDDRAVNSTKILHDFDNITISQIDFNNTKSSVRLEPDEKNSTSRYEKIIELLTGKRKKDIVKSAKTSGLTESRVVRGLEIAGISLAIGIAVGASICLLGPLITCICIYCMGYRRAGVKEDSYASRWQSTKPNVEAGSCFASCQRRGATGSTPVKKIFIVAFVAGVIASIVSVSVMLSK